MRRVKGKNSKTPSGSLIGQVESASCSFMLLLLSLSASRPSERSSVIGVMPPKLDSNSNSKFKFRPLGDRKLGESTEEEEGAEDAEDAEDATEEEEEDDALDCETDRSEVGCGMVTTRIGLSLSISKNPNRGSAQQNQQRKQISLL